MDAKVFAEWGWRIPFWLSLILLVFSIYIRLKLHESPIFQKMKAEGKGSKSPLRTASSSIRTTSTCCLRCSERRPARVWSGTRDSSTRSSSCIITLKLDYVSTYTLIGLSLLIGTPFFIFFGWLSDRIGRLKIILAGCLIAAVTYFPLFQGLTHYVNPALEAFAAKTRSPSRQPTASSTSSSDRGASSPTATGPRTS
jgi:MFS family permease